ncbi:uncharacterized protein F4822DRAFT_235276 [Hypoxylon trugodes]|uniref:uncharacterized protein n=1 Tax=Hypoxylon trugodes TaxID=326681 RepID=UPI00219DECEC|nr:uncharacterized protein F4822DRAFT_235276 [Hypoxylon trugodes]KAI1390405.1 hypothetical protein F4822DRAFT_235276 [Hypoxylon trugodes]
MKDSQDDDSRYDIPGTTSSMPTAAERQSMKNVDGAQQTQDYESQPLGNTLDIPSAFGAFERNVEGASDIVRELMDMCRGLHDHNDASVLAAQINIGKNYCAVLEENKKIRDYLKRRAAYEQMERLELQQRLYETQFRLRVSEILQTAMEALRYMDRIDEDRRVT